MDLRLLISLLVGEKLDLKFIDTPMPQILDMTQNSENGKKTCFWIFTIFGIDPMIVFFVLSDSEVAFDGTSIGKAPLEGYVWH